MAGIGLLIAVAAFFLVPGLAAWIIVGVVVIVVACIVSVNNDKERARETQLEREKQALLRKKPQRTSTSQQTNTYFSRLDSLDDQLHRH